MRGQLLVFPSRKEGNLLKPLETTSLLGPEITWRGRTCDLPQELPRGAKGSQCTGYSSTGVTLRKSGNAVCDVGLFPSITFSCLEEPSALWKSSCSFVKCLT